MAIELAKPELRSYELRKKRYKQKMKAIILMVILGMIVLVTYMIQQFINKEYNSYEVIHHAAREDSSSALYRSYNGGVIRYSRDGIMAMDNQGKMMWNGTYEMKHPIIDVNNGYVVVADKGNKFLQIYNGGKQPSELTMLGDIIDIEIASQGVIAVLMEGDGYNLVQLYTEEGEKLAEWQTSNKKDGFPMDIDLSYDGRSLMTSYMYLNEGVLQNKITFISFGPVASTYIDQVVGTFPQGNIIFPEVKFVTNDKAVGFGDGRLSIYHIEKTPSLIKDIEINEEINSIFYSEEYVGMVLKNLDGEEKYLLVVYDLEGNRILNLKNNYEHKNIMIKGKDIIMTGDNTVHIVTLEGKLRLNLELDKNLEYFFPTENRREYILIDNLEMQLVKLAEEKKE